MTCSRSLCRSGIALGLLALAGLLTVGSSRSRQSSTVATPRVKCDAAPGEYPASPLGKWIALVKNDAGNVVSYGVVVISESGGKVVLYGKNYDRSGNVKYTWHGNGSWNGTTLIYVWKIHGANPGINKMVLSNGNARLSGWWVRKGAKGTEAFCRAL